MRGSNLTDAAVLHICAKTHMIHLDGASNRNCISSFVTLLNVLLKADVK